MPGSVVKVLMVFERSDSQDEGLHRTDKDPACYSTVVAPL